jgi:hypothetical protein
MKFYIVGTAEPLITMFFLSPERRNFTKDNLLENLKNMKEIPFFESLEYAIDYARSLRVQSGSKLPNPQKIKFAPVIEIECDDDVFLAEINSHNTHTDSITYTKYEDTTNNLDDLEKQQETVSYKRIPTPSINLTLMQIESVTFPDSGREIQYFAPNLSCTLM